MSEFDEFIIQLAESSADPDDFISKMEKICEECDFKKDIFNAAGYVLIKFSYYVLALSLWNYALKYYIKIKNLYGVSGCYMNLGNAYCAIGDFGKAIEYTVKALEIYREIGDRAGEATCYANLGFTYGSLGDFKKAIEYTNTALEIDIESRDRSEESRCYTILGSAHHSLRDFGKAIEYYEKALEINRQNGDRVEESKCYTILGSACQGLSDFRKSIEYTEKALEIIHDIGDMAGEATCYTILGSAYRGLSDFRRAIEYHEKALEIYREIGDRAGEAACYTYLGSACQGLSDFRKAIEYTEKALKINIEIEDRVGESKCYTILSSAHHSLRDFGKAIEYTNIALKMSLENEDRSEESKCYTNLGNAYNGLGNFRKANEYYKMSLDIVTEIGDRVGESACYTNLGVAYRGLGDFRGAIEYHEKALEIDRKIRDRAGEAICHRNLGVAYGSLGDFRKAIEYYEASLKIAVEIGDRVEESGCYANLGIAFRDLGDFRTAIEHHEMALEIFKSIGDLDGERITNYVLCADFYESDPELAYSYCIRSIELSEMISGRLVEEEHKIGFQARTSDAYRSMIPLCMKLGKEEEAFEYAERGKSRAFLEMLAATDFRPTVELTDELQLLLDQEKNHLARLREIQMRHLKQSRVRVEPGEVERINESLNQIYDNLENLDPEYVYVRRGRPLSPDELQGMLAQQKRDVVLIEYYTTPEETYIFLVSSRDKELHVKTAPISEDKLRLYYENYLREVVNHPRYGDIGESWLALGEYLIDPVSEYLAEGDLVYFVPHGVLHYLPLHALMQNGEPLIVNHPVAYSPSASLIRFCRSKGSGKLESCASFGVEFVKEAEEVAKLFGVEPHGDPLATNKEVMEYCMGKDVIHFSCHGRFDVLDPLSSGVELYGGVLTARDIFGMRLDSELVTLSACQTGLNERSPGDELIGLTRAFLYAGSPSVVVSLWSVDARSTQELMVEFYRLLRDGCSIAEALQEAQRRMKEKYPHPYYWAPFILVGDWE